MSQATYIPRPNTAATARNIVEEDEFLRSVVRTAKTAFASVPTAGGWAAVTGLLAMAITKSSDRAVAVGGLAAFIVIGGRAIVAWKTPGTTAVSVAPEAPAPLVTTNAAPPPTDITAPPFPPDQPVTFAASQVPGVIRTRDVTPNNDRNTGRGDSR